MRVLLDTHFVIWMVNDSTQLRRSETLIINRRREDICVSVVALWELRTKWEAIDRLGRRKGVISPEAAASFLNASDIAIAPLSRDAVLTPLKVEIDHNDPFDRMLLIHAQHLGARLLTRDRRLAAHPLSLPL